MTYTELLDWIWRLRRTAQLLAAFLGDDLPADVASELDALASLAYQRGRAR